MASENQKKLRRLLAKGNVIGWQIRLDVPVTTLRRHLTSKEAPHPSWIAYYEEGLGYEFRGWFRKAYADRVAKAAKKLREVAQEERMKP